MARRAAERNDVHDVHVVLDLDCLDRIDLNACVPNLQVVSFLSEDLGTRYVPAIFDKFGTMFRGAVAVS